MKSNLSALVLVAALPFALMGERAAAAANDIDLLGLVDNTGKPDDVGFRGLVRELGLVMTPTSLQPAETTGQSGFDFGLDYGFHTLRFDEAYWQDTRENPATPLLMTLGARVRKGFVLPVPLTSEVELGAQWLIESELLSMGANVRVALNEGFRWIPDIAAQLGVNRMVGHKDLDLLTVSAGGQISKGFGIAGSLNLCPFVGYQSIWVNGASRILDIDPSDSSNIDDNVVFEQAAIGDNRMDRVSVGARVIVAVVHVTAGLDMNFVQPVAGTNAGGEAELLMQYSVRAGVAF